MKIGKHGYPLLQKISITENQLQKWTKKNIILNE